MFKNKCELPIELVNKCKVGFYMKDKKEYFIVVSDLKYYLFDVSNGFEEILSEPLENICATFSNNGRYIAYCLENSCIVIDIHD